MTMYDLYDHLNRDRGFMGVHTPVIPPENPLSPV